MTLSPVFRITSRRTPPGGTTKPNSAGNSSILYTRLAAERTAHEQTNLQRRIDATDRQIDRLVYDLYDLTDDEIRTIEGATT